MEKIKILLYYKYVPIEKPEVFAKKHLEDCKNLGLKGRILVSKEGINGSVSGTQEQVDSYKKLLTSNKLFKGIAFKEDEGLTHPFKRMVIKIKNEIVRFEHDVNMNNVGKHLSPKQFLDLYHDVKNKPVIIDARNDYEARVGKFKDAVTLPIKTFTQFPQAILKLGIPKNKPIAMYCTGGVRCEKASAFLKDNGYKDVSQLSGGILSFGKEFPDTVWEGKCFVFDKRLVSPINKNDTPFSNCDICNLPCDLYKNCRNVNCDKYTIICINCDDKLSGCCSKVCQDEFLSHRNVKQNSKNKLTKEVMN